MKEGDGTSDFEKRFEVTCLAVQNWMGDKQLIYDSEGVHG
jgi:hypothetical protein